MNLGEMYGGTEYGLFIGETLLKSAPHKDAIIDNILYERDVICISSKAGVGKSVLAQQLMCCLTTGTPFLETFNVNGPCNVLYIQTEGDRAETIERLRLMEKTVPVDHARWAHLNLPGIGLNVEKDFDQLMALLKTVAMIFHVIIIDPLYTTIKGDMSKNEVATDWIRNIRTLKTWLDCAVIVLNHEGKDLYNEGAVVDRGSATIFGSTFWAAFFNSNYKLKVFDGHHLLEVGKDRSGKSVDKIAMRMITDGTLAYVPHHPDLTANGIKVLALIKDHNMITARRIVEITGVSQAQTYRILRKLEDQAKIERKHHLDNGLLSVVFSLIKDGGVHVPVPQTQAV